MIGGGAALALVSSTSLLGSLGGLGVFGPAAGIAAAGNSQSLIRFQA